MRGKPIPYTIDGNSHIGYMATPEGEAKRPLVLVAHAWKGLDDFAKRQAEELAKLGYVAFAADLFGEGRCITSDEEAFQTISPLFAKRELLQQRICVALEKALAEPTVDPERVGAIGFCFGGLTVIELLRSGKEVRGVVSFHGLLGDTLGELRAERAATAEMKGALLLLHGYKDPMVSHDDIVSIQKEMSQANVDWQMHTYGSAYHAFTNPEAHQVEAGLVYDTKAKSRSWQAMCEFFREIF